ncbi:MAG: polyprenyl synthetase family protein [Anaerolineales bacterium]|nr:polyprenyl synthetase family protein [Anaerolineales bacterium]
MPLRNLTSVLLPAIEDELRQVVFRARQPDLGEIYFMLAYHMGWEGDDAGPEARGKRIRPILLLLSAAAQGADWQPALPAAAAVELIHNFSLAHDDIQDQSPLRRGRLTLWKRWGVAQAINAGDAMFALAFISLQGIERSVSPQVALRAAQVLQQACLALTHGQHLDLAYEARLDLTPAAYWPMVSGKTGALLAACAEIGALAAQAPGPLVDACRRFGRLLGLAFQAQDDLLGIWGDAALTGKSAESDLLSGKKSLPVLYGLSQNGDFARRWAQGPVTPEEVPSLAAQLELEGGRAFTQEQANDLTSQALEALQQAQPQGEAGEALTQLARKLLSRET